MCPRSSNSPALQVANLGWPSKRPKVAQGSTKGKHTLQECLDVLVYNTDLSCVMAGLAPAPKKRKPCFCPLLTAVMVDMKYARAPF